MTGRSNKKRVLFLCTGNSCRSQMAEAFLREVAGGEFQVHSAGPNPTRVNPMAVRAMAEVGIDISTHRSKPVDEMISLQFDFVITVCDLASEACPIFPGVARMLHWSFEDPAEAAGTQEQRLGVFLRVRDEIAARVRSFASDAT